jgi:hypothetical protein
LNRNVFCVSRTLPVMIAKHLIPALALLFSPLCVAISQEDKGDTTPTSGPSTFSGKTIDQMTADEVLKLVRFSYTLYNRDFTGQLTMGFKKKVPFLLSLNPDSIRFIFDDPAQLIYLDTRNKDFSLLEGVGGKDMAPVSPEKYGEPIRGTDVTYDDLSMRFIYWPNAKIIGQEKMKGRETIKVRVRNPDGKGAYATVDIWIDKESGGMLKMTGWNNQGRPIRNFEVLHGKKFDDIWMVDEMRIETVSGATGGTVESSTRMTIKSAVD